MGKSLKKFIESHEGYETHPYVCPAGKITIGIGHNLTDNGLSHYIIGLILKEDIQIAKDDLDRLYPAWRALTQKRRWALVDMIFNLGSVKILSFVKFWKALDDEDYTEASIQMLDSRWARQVGHRAYTLSQMMDEG